VGRLAVSGRTIWWSVLAVVWAVPVALGLVPVRDELERVGFAYALATAFVLTHELGHAVVGRLLGYRIFEVSIGVGPRLVRLRVGRTRFEMRLFPLGGHTMLAPRSDRLLQAREAFVALAGSAVNVVAVAWALTADLDDPVVLAVVVFGGLLVVENLFPRRVKNPLGVLESDGMRAAKALDADEAALRDALAARYLGEASIDNDRGDHQAELAWLERGLSELPESAVLRGGAAVVRIVLRRYDEARERLLEVLERDDLQPIQRAIHLNNLAWTDLVLDDPDLLPEALAASKEALATAPQIPAFKGTRGFALVLGGRIEEGISLSAEASRGGVTRDDRASNLVVMAIGAARIGRIETAENRLMAAVRLSPRNALLDRGIAELDRARALRDVSHTR
jgi:tetratricopeptide (TPR) repeat protein